MGKVFAYLDTLQALAMQTALCLPDRLFPRVSLLRLHHGDRGCRRNTLSVCKELRFEWSLLITVCRQRSLLQETLDGEHGIAAVMHRCNRRKSCGTITLGTTGKHLGVTGGKGECFNRNASVIQERQFLFKTGSTGWSQTQIHSIELFDHDAQAWSRLRVAADPRVQAHLDEHVLKHCEVFINPLLRQILFAQSAQAPRELAAGFKEDHLEALRDQVKGRR